ncbi:MAG: NAD-dependent epimerase/dehydratase family protein [Candidatus Protistobacter heckmanni]|nr:NAD-dependent epimerase/dehydratase family protein [Candidatus Protistobacter heckmanni]
MRILIAGGAGFLGARLAHSLLAQSGVAEGGPGKSAKGSAGKGGARNGLSLILADRIAPPPDLARDPCVTAAVGELTDLVAGGLISADVDAVCHFAAAVSGECERDFELDLRSNLLALTTMLEAFRARVLAGGQPPRVVFASSVSIFGAGPGERLPDPVVDASLPAPQSSYGTQKFVGEQLIAEYSRKGYIHGRNARLMTVSVRPGKPNQAASGFLSGIVREPLSGLRANCPVPMETAVALSSPARAGEGLRKALFASELEWPWRSAVNLPARFVSQRAASLGLLPDPGYEQVIRDYIAEQGL